MGNSASLGEKEGYPVMLGKDLVTSFLPSIWFFLSWCLWERPGRITAPVLILRNISPARPWDRDSKYASADWSKVATRRPLGERDDAWNACGSKETSEKHWAGSEVPSLGASTLCYFSFLGQLQNPIPCLGWFLPLDIYVKGHTAMHLQRSSSSHLFTGF